MRGEIVVAGAALLWVTAVCAESTTPHLDTSGVNMQPAYPATAMADKEQGAVLLGVEVTPEGRAGKINLLETSGHSDLDAAAIAAVFGWKFIPAMTNGQPAVGTTQVVLAFQAPDAPATTAGAIKPVGNFIPKMLQIPDDPSRSFSLIVPCSNGGLTTRVLMSNSLDTGRVGEPNPAMFVKIRSGDDAVVLELGSLQITFKRTRGQSVLSEQDYPYRHIMGLGMAITWDPSGHVSATVGDAQYQSRLPLSPTRITFAAVGRTGMVFNSDFFCSPAASAASAH
jgi:TonB family protein